MRTNPATPIVFLQAGIAVGMVSLLALLLIMALPRVTELGQAQVVYQRDAGTWHYIAVRRDSAIHATTYHDSTSVRALKDYADANLALCDKLAQRQGDLAVDITFRNFVPPEQFRSWALAMGLHVTTSEVGAIDSNGSEGAGNVAGEPSDPLPPGAIDTLLEPLRRHVGVRKVPGIFFTSASVDAKQLPGIAADPLVFITDVTSNVVRDDLVSAGISGDDQAIVEPDLPTPFWEMEHTFGLDNFKK